MTSSAACPARQKRDEKCRKMVSVTTARGSLGDGGDSNDNGVAVGIQGVGEAAVVEGSTMEEFSS